MVYLQKIMVLKALFHLQNLYDKRVEFVHMSPIELVFVLNGSFLGKFMIMLSLIMIVFLSKRFRFAVHKFFALITGPT